MNRKKGLTKSIRFWGLVVAGLFTIAIIGCIAAIPIAIVYFSGDKGYVATAQVPLPADEIYKTALKQAEEAKDKNVTIVDKNDAKHTIEVTDGVQKATFEAQEVDSKNSVITVRATVPVKKDVENAKEEKIKAQKELALQIVTNLCKAAKAECTVVKQDEGSQEKK
jgi:enamine deaminase RidA (YjgF/YER057c/UK114 family)